MEELDPDDEADPVVWLLLNEPADAVDEEVPRNKYPRKAPNNRIAIANIQAGRFGLSDELREVLRDEDFISTSVDRKGLRGLPVQLDCRSRIR